MFCVTFPTIYADCQWDNYGLLCGVRSDNKEVECFQNEQAYNIPITSESFVATVYLVCGLTTNHTVLCTWSAIGLQQDPPYYPTDVQFSSLAAYGLSVCGIRMNDSEVQCWRGGNLPFAYYGDVYYEVIPTDKTKFIHASLGSLCGIRLDGTIWCSLGYNTLLPPRQVYLDGENYTKVVSNAFGGCGLRTDGTINCDGNSVALTGSGFSFDFTPINNETFYSNDTIFEDIIAGEFWICGLTQGDRFAVCTKDSQIPSGVGIITATPSLVPYLGVFDELNCLYYTDKTANCFDLGLIGTITPCSCSWKEAVGTESSMCAISRYYTVHVCIADLLVSTIKRIVGATVIILKKCLKYLFTS